MISLWIFGTTTGFEVQTIGPELPVNITREWVSLPPEIELNSDGVISTFRRNVDGKTLTWIGLYRKIFEVGYQRRGGFYGAGVWLIDQQVDANVVLPIILKLADSIKLSCIVGSQFVRRLAEANPRITPSASEAQALANSTERVSGNGISPVSIRSAFFSNSSDVYDIINWALKTQEAATFRSVYIGSNEQFVRGNSSISRFNGLSDVYRVLYEDERKEKSLLKEKINIDEAEIKSAQESNLALRTKNNLHEQTIDGLNLKIAQLKNKLEEQISKYNALRAHKENESSEFVARSKDVSDPYKPYKRKLPSQQSTPERATLFAPKVIITALAGSILGIILVGAWLLIRGNTDSSGSCDASPHSESAGGFADKGPGKNLPNDPGKFPQRETGKNSTPDLGKIDQREAGKNSSTDPIKNAQKESGKNSQKDSFKTLPKTEESGAMNGLHPSENLFPEPRINRYQSAPEAATAADPDELKNNKENPSSIERTGRPETKPSKPKAEDIKKYLKDRFGNEFLCNGPVNNKQTCSEERSSAIQLEDYYSLCIDKKKIQEENCFMLIVTTSSANQAKLKEKLCLSKDGNKFCNQNTNKE